MRKCDGVVTVDVLNNDKNNHITDKIEFSFEVVDEYDCIDSIETMLENLLDNNEIEVDKRYIIIVDIKQEETYDYEYGTQYDEYLEVKEIFLIDTDICKKYYIEDFEENKKDSDLKIVELI